MVEKKYKTVYETVENILYKIGNKLEKKHGNWITVYCPKNQLIYMDSWNGAISMAHAKGLVWSNGFTLESDEEISTHTTVSPPEYCNDLEAVVDIYKTLLGLDLEIVI